jgi:peptide/nickel transport system substrate-binding protein
VGKVNVQADAASGTGNLIWFNVAKPPFNDVRARLAVAYGTNRATYLPADPGSSMADSLVPPGMFGHAAQTQYPYDEAKARQLFAAAGVQPGTTLNMAVADTGGGQNRELAQLIAQDLAKFGITLNIRVDTPYFQAQMNQPADQSTWHLGYAALSYAYNDPEAVFWRAWYSGSTQNWTHYKNEKLDQLLLEQQRTADPAARAQKLAEIQRIAWEDVPMFPTNRSVVNVLGSNKWVHGLELTPVLNGFLFQYAWLDKK